MHNAGFRASDDDTALEMVEKLLGKIASQQTLEDGLRERLRSVDYQHREREVNTEWGRDCPFLHGEWCLARDKWYTCAKSPSLKGCPDDLRTPCRLDEGPILVKKEDSGSDRDEVGEATTAERPGGDPLNGPRSPG